MCVEEDIARVAEQEKRLVFGRFDETTARDLADTIRELAQAAGAALVIDVRFWSRQLYFCAMPGTSPDNSDWVRRKSNCVRRFERASYAIGLRQQLRRGGGFGPDDNVDLSDIAAHGGSFPIRIDGVGVIGAITVSGVPSRQDHALVVEGICRYLGVDYAGLALPPEAGAP